MSNDSAGRDWIISESDLLHLMSIKIGAEYVSVSDASERLRIKVSPLSRQSAQGAEESKVMGRVHNDRAQGEAWLNSEGRKLPDNAPLYAVPPDTVSRAELEAAIIAEKCKHSDSVEDVRKHYEERFEQYRKDAEKRIKLLTDALKQERTWRLEDECSHGEVCERIDMLMYGIDRAMQEQRK